MLKRKLVAGYRAFFALLVVVAIIVQFADAARRPGFRPLNFFSFFTIESNILAAAVFAFGAIAQWRGKKPGPRFAVLRGAAVLYMVTTGIVYNVLLSGLEDSLQTPLGWVNVVLHDLFPLAVLLDWLADLPRTRIAHRKVLLWLIFPAIYAAYSLVRGPIAHWYPYPFLDPRTHGYARVAAMCVIIAVVIYGLGLLVAAVTRFAPAAPRMSKPPKRRSA